MARYAREEVPGVETGDLFVTSVDVSAIDTAGQQGEDMIRAAAIASVAVAILAGCGGTSEADIAACKTAMNTSSTGIIQWTQDKSTRPEACKKLDDKDFNKASTEWYDEFNKKLKEAQSN